MIPSLPPQIAAIHVMIRKQRRRANRPMTNTEAVIKLVTLIIAVVGVAALSIQVLFGNP
jgi:hypothetical protein